MNIFAESKRIRLRQLVSADEADLLDLDSDPEVMKYLTNGKPSSRESIQRSLARVSEQLKSSNGRFGVWAAIEMESDQFIGWFHLFPAPDEPRNLTKLFLGYRLKKKHWGNGYATEVSKMLIEKAFLELGATEVCGQAMKQNLASQRVMEKCGMQFRHEFEEKSFPEGFRVAVLFSVSKVQFRD